MPGLLPADRRRSGPRSRRLFAMHRAMTSRTATPGPDAISAPAVASTNVTNIRWAWAAIANTRPMSELRLNAQIVKGHQELPSGGREFCPLVATRSAQWWPPEVPRVLVQGYHSLPREGLG